MLTLPRQYLAHLQHKERLTATVMKLTFMTTETLAYQPGQYATWLLGQHRRPMSFAAPAAGRQAEFLVDITPGGIASQFCEQARRGDELRFLAPYGHFVLDPALTRPRLFLATGTGIAPIRAQLRADQTDRPTTLIFGTRRSEYRFLDEELTALARQRRQLKVIPVCLEADPPWSGLVGHAAHIAVKVIDQLPHGVAYICGSPTFVREAITILTAHHLSRQQIHCEEYRFSPAVIS